MDLKGQFSIKPFLLFLYNSERGDLFLWEFIAKYWLEFLFGLVATVLTSSLTALAKKYYSLYKKGLEVVRGEEFVRLENLIAETDKNDSVRIKNLEQKVLEANTKQDKSIDAIRSGVLELQKERFIAFGKELLSEDHHITYDEFEAFEKKHEAYNKLGGNHEGDLLFKNV